MTELTRSRPERTVTLVWVALMVITLGSWWLAPGHSGAPSGPSTGATALILVLALIKSRLIIRYFMEVRSAPRWLVRGTDGWLAVVFVTIFVIYLIGTAR